MAHRLNLPDLPARQPGDGSWVEWDVRLERDGDIAVRLVAKHSYMSSETIAKVEESTPARAETEAERIWENYKAVKGIEA